MIADAIKLIQALAVQADAPKEIELPGGKSVLIEHLGKLTAYDVPPPDRRHKIENLHDFVAFIRGETGCDDEGGGLGVSSIFVGPEQIEFVYDMEDRRDRAILYLHLSDRWAALSSIVKPRSFSVRDAVRFLRYSLADTGVDPLLANIRTLDFERQSRGKANIVHGRETLGQSVEASVQQADLIPEEFVVDCQIFNVLGLRDIRFNVRVGLYLDVQGQQIEMGVLGDQMKGAHDSARAEIVDRLRVALPKIQSQVGTP